MNRLGHVSAVLPLERETQWRLTPPAREMIHKLRDRPVALQLDTDQATWGIAYEKYMPYSASLGSLRLWHRPAGQQRFHDQVCIEFADKKGRGLRALVQYIRQHDIDYLEGDPTVFSYRLIDLRELVQAIDARYFAQRAIARYPFLRLRLTPAVPRLICKIGATRIISGKC